MVVSLLPGIPAGATLYQRAVTNSIGVTAATSNSIGYLGTNRTQLEVAAQLTGQDPTDMYNFTFQNNDYVRMNLVNIDGEGSVRMQLFDGSGSRVLADNQGSTDLQNAFDDLTGKKGIKLTAGQYVIKITYGKDGDKSQKQDYAIQLGSGTTFTADYRTLAAATTVHDTLLAGGQLGYSSLSSTAAMLTSANNGESLSSNIFGLLAQFPTKIFA